jgi:hypothetical protein
LNPAGVEVEATAAVVFSGVLATRGACKVREVRRNEVREVRRNEVREVRRNEVREVRCNEVREVRSNEVREVRRNEVRKVREIRSNKVREVRSRGYWCCGIREPGGVRRNTVISSSNNAKSISCSISKT